MAVGTSITVHRDFHTTVTQVRDALADQGFGVITEIDVQATMAAKLNVEYDHFLILGACNPVLAHRAIEADATIGTLLPCNVVVRQSGDDVVVESIDPQLLVTTTGEGSLAPVAQEAAVRLRKALDTVAGE
jgi:uncharacterized protein (DUF302 family)